MADTFPAAYGPGELDGEASAEFESVLMRISTTFAGARWNQVGAEVDIALGQLLAYCRLEQACLFEVLPDDEEAYLRHVACAPDTRAAPERFSYGAWFPWAFRKVVFEREVLAVTSPGELPPEAAVDEASMRALGVCSQLHVPLLVQGEVRFVLTAVRSGREPTWSERCVTRLRAVSEIFAHAISRAEASATLLAIESDVRDTLEVAHLGHWAWDIGAGKLRLTDEAKHVLGADVPTIAHLMALVEPGDRRALERAIERARAQPGVRFKIRYSIRTPAGEVRSIQQWHETLFPGERTARLVATVQNVTAVAKAEHEVAELRAHHWHSARVAQTALLVASLAHELSQPLAAILTNAQAGLRFLNSDNLSREDMRDILTDIVASDKRASEVLGALRAMLKRQRTARVTFDAVEAVNDVLALVRSELMSEQIEVESALAAGCYLNADKIQIEQVLLNLVMNAIDAMRPKHDGAKLLQISVSSGDGDTIELAVKDAGGGIPGDKLGRVFEAFWTTKKKGLGMGLPVCRAIVESYGGRIWCESNDAGGVTFRFKLPAANHPLELPGASPAEKAHH